MKRCIKPRIYLPPINASHRAIEGKMNQKMISMFFFKDNSGKRRIKREGSYYQKNTESERELRVLENIFPRTVKSEYIHKLCQLLKKKDANYLMKRMNLSDTYLAYDENNNLYLTLSKLVRSTNEKNDKQIGDLNSEDIDIGIGMDLISEDSDFSKPNEDEKKVLFEHLRTRNLMKPKEISSSNTSVKKAPSYMSIPVVQDIHKLREKTIMIDKVSKKKMKTPLVELFQYDRNKEKNKRALKESNPLSFEWRTLEEKRKEKILEISQSVSQLKNLSGGLKRQVTLGRYKSSRIPQDGISTLPYVPSVNCKTKISLPEVKILSD